MPSPGQRWISTSEPGLGLGVVDEVEGDRVGLVFPAAEERRLYAFGSAPLIRVRFEPGDEVRDREGHALQVDSVEERGDLLVYHCGGEELEEEDLLDSLNFIRPEKRLLAGLCEPPRDFDRRLEALDWNARIRQSELRGFSGARIDLIGHQLAIVAEATGRLHPRLLLADEVGLGKTIEACLILHHLQITGRASRVLILVPEPLIHQWFVELLRRFHLTAAIFDEERCQSIEANEPDANPFLDSQLILAATDFLAGNETRAAQAAGAGFELLIVDEAHHLEWSPASVSAPYQVVEQLAAVVPSLLLLTATPQQLGPEGHFARLRLLDPRRYADLDAFAREVESYGPLATALDGLLSGGRPEGLEELLDRSPRALEDLRRLQDGDEEARGRLVQQLIESFGTGRLLFRNTRRQLQGFPERRPHLHPLAEGQSPYAWLAGLLRAFPAQEKVLLITSSPEAAISVQEKLLQEIQIESALFHEDLTLLQRDRNAAWFADREGARILICSEIGSEGRNFQFARHLVLFGLPRDPELLEQRIGRLDRIGQQGTIHIHVPYGVGSRSELHARWLHEGLDALRQPLKGATTLATILLPELDQIDETDSEAVEDFLRRSRQLAAEVDHNLTTGHDRLLELGAPPPETARAMIAAIEEADRDPAFEKFTIRMLDQQGLDVSDLSARSYHLHRGQRHSEAFADLPEEGLSVTFDRITALAREDLTFLTRDHPLLRGALEQWVDSEAGNASFALWRTGKGKAVLLECAFVLEAIAPQRLHVERHLPPTLIRVVVDHRAEVLDPAVPSAQLTAGDPRRLVTQESFRHSLFPAMLEAAHKQAGELARPVIAQSLAAMENSLRAEIARLEDLAVRNPRVTVEEIQMLRDRQEELALSLAEARLRLDALRLIWCS